MLPECLPPSFRSIRLTVREQITIEDFRLIVQEQITIEDFQDGRRGCHHGYEKM